jgi:hypothetical protein
MHADHRHNGRADGTKGNGMTTQDFGTVHHFARWPRRLPGALGLILIVALAAALPQASLAQGSPGTTPARYGVVWRISGEVSAVSAASTTRALRTDAVVFVGDRIVTPAGAELVILTDDAGMIAVRANTEFLAQDFEARGQKVDRMALRLLRGSLRVITGWVGLVNRDGYRLSTPVATIGIRGTDHETVVLTPEQALAMEYEPGAYDKVNRGGTVLTTQAGQVEIAAGRVGFARQLRGTEDSSRGLMTLLLPTLLERVPDFYVGGRFDRELDEYSDKADALIRERLEEARRKIEGAAAKCAGEAAALTWLSRFDEAVQARDTDAILRLFAHDARISASVKSGQGKVTTLSFTHEEFARSVQSAAQNLQEYQQRRLTVETEVLPAPAGDACGALQIRSRVVEQGRLAEQPYQVESVEEHRLQLRGEEWLAVESRTTQQ